MPQPNRHNEYWPVLNRFGVGSALMLGAVSLTLAGCQTPGEYRTEADEAAYNIIDQRRAQTVNQDTPLRIERPADTLRRRLMLDQHLPTASPASRSSRDMDVIPQWPDKDSYLSDEPGDDRAAPNAPVASDGDPPLRLTLEEALQVAARNNRDYQAQKEGVFLEALDLDLERDAFRLTWEGLLSSGYIFDRTSGDSVSGIENSAELGASKLLRNGTLITTNLAVDLAQLLTGGDGSAIGVRGDASIAIPLMRGSGRFIVTEPLRQAERDVIYAIYDFERFKRSFAVDVASQYLRVLELLDQVGNAEENYRNLIKSTRRAQRLAEAGRLPEIQVDQARQNELRARERWIRAQTEYARNLDGFKLRLGLPVDAAIELDRDELQRLTQAAEPMLQNVTGIDEAAAYEAGMAAALRDRSNLADTDLPPGGVIDTDEGRPIAVGEARDGAGDELEIRPGPPADAEVVLEPVDRTAGGQYELAEDKAIRLALDNRLDLRTAIARIYDEQRGVVLAADDLRADLTLLGRADAGSGRSLSSANLEDGDLDVREGRYSALLTIDLPFERTAERNRYRAQLIALERQVRQLQELEDSIKLSVRNTLRGLVQARESVRIQARSAELARRRVESTSLFLEAGRAEIRDLLEAQESLIAAENALTSAIVDYRVAEISLQRDLGLLDVADNGLWREFDPEDPQPLAPQSELLSTNE